jgi:hypothetical protein
LIRSRIEATCTENWRLLVDLIKSKIQVVYIENWRLVDLSEVKFKL